MFDSATELFAPIEIAQAAGVAEARVLDAMGGARFVPLAEATTLGKGLAASALFARVDRRLARTFGGVPLVLSGTAHATVLTAMALLLMPGPATEARTSPEPLTNEPRLVYLNLAGPGGGGGGGGRLQREAPRRALNAGRHAMKSPAPPVAAPPPAAPETLPPLAAEPMPPVLAPVAPVAGDLQTRAGDLQDSKVTDSLGAGTGGVAGNGRGTGVGAGQGSGIGQGTGGGTGGGPFRPGSGIEPPRLLREVKPGYSDDARRLGVSGEVLLEIVVRSDGRVGDVRVLRGLRTDLDERAIAAVRQWLFAAATRGGEPVDVLVEVAVDFNIR
jgi:protein TonB